MPEIVSLPTGGIQSVGYVANNYNLRDVVANYFDWANLYNDSKTFAALNAFGQVSVTEPMGSASGNYRVLFNKPTGFCPIYETDASFVLTVTSPYCNLAADLAGELSGAYKGAVHPTFTLNQVTSSRGSLSSANATKDNLAIALDLVNIKIREGLGLRFMGGLYDSSNNLIDGAYCAFVITGVSGDHLQCELMDTNVELDTTGVAPVYLASIKGAVKVFVTDFAEFDGAAPAADDMGTTQYGNWLQMYDSTIGKGFSEESQATYFDNTFETLIPPLRTLQNVKMNTDLLYGARGAIPVGGNNSGTSRGAMKGIWGLMNLSNPALNKDRARPEVRVAQGQTLDYWDLYRFIVDRPSYVNKSMLCIMPPTMDTLLKQAMNESRELERVSSISFPSVPGSETYSVKVGDTTLHCIVDKTLSWHPRFTDYKSALDHEANSSNPLVNASQGCVMLMLDMRYAGIVYQQNKELGLMIPQIANIPSVNDERKKRAHLMACWTTAMWNPQMHAFYGLKQA